MKSWNGWNTISENNWTCVPEKHHILISDRIIICFFLQVSGLEYIYIHIPQRDVPIDINRLYTLWLFNVAMGNHR